MCQYLPSYPKISPTPNRRLSHSKFNEQFNEIMMTSGSSLVQRITGRIGRIQSCSICYQSPHSRYMTLTRCVIHRHFASGLCHTSTLLHQEMDHVSLAVLCCPDQAGLTKRPLERWRPASTVWSGLHHSIKNRARRPLGSANHGLQERVAEVVGGSAKKQPHDGLLPV